MVSKKPRIVIIGAGMAGIAAANKLYTSGNSRHPFELAVVEGGGRIGGRIHTAEFCGDRIEQGATWIHGIGGSPVHEIARHDGLLQSEQPWECMDGNLEEVVTIAEGGHELSNFVVEPISSLFNLLMDFIQGKSVGEDGVRSEVLRRCKLGPEDLSVGCFLRRGLEAYWNLTKDQKGVKGVGCWNRKSVEDAIFAMHEAVQRTYTSAEDLYTLDYKAEKEYVMFPGEEITIAKGYSRVVESMASVLPDGMIQLNKKVERIEWVLKKNHPFIGNGADYDNRPVKLQFSDGSVLSADHVIVTVSLGVLKNGIRPDSALFHPPLPSSKTGAISRLGYGIVNKVFLQIETNDSPNFPFLQMAFHPPDSELRNPKIPDWIRRTSFISPIYNHSRVLLSWFTGEEALELESMAEEEIISGFNTVISDFQTQKPVTVSKIFRTQWGTNPLFLGSYSYIAVGSSIEDTDILAEPLPPESMNLDHHHHPLQILFAGEASHRTHYSTTHGAYYSGLREANRLLKFYNCAGL